MSWLGALTRWRQRRQARSRERVLQRRAIPDALWLDTLRDYPFLKRRPLAELQLLRELTALFLDRKEFCATGGLEMTDAMAVAIAAQACVPILHLGLEGYDSFVGIVVHPDEVVKHRKVTDDDGVVHDYDETSLGEAMYRGPLSLSWRHVVEGAVTEPWVCNVVIHEFVHVLDMADGEVDGVPPQPSAGARRHWIQVMEAAHARLCRAMDRGEPTFLDPYASEHLSEFFPVASEAFFVDPQGLSEAHPEVYDLLRDYFHQDPARHVR
ncbi:MAG TPA: zinc-dependent peptidase [Burkholderiaceae bacterium]|nr:zinc-dependent peptidase [Burkholderiaceae bacterium]HMX10113.1 zinc-dependent peptidase [Burkholderiaceae bacterium]HMY99196.1 zinc-dependent peptidase [Burkholderiaceae bacterium]HNB43871.1 zinc-dependent peptidase [Burkholderiaceae bacterium]HNG79030.1 zinc-dependent peptidase [Burkholderiaceae bacterium]